MADERQFRVVHSVADRAVDAVIVESELPGINFDALVSSGHLVEVDKPKKQAEKPLNTGNQNVADVNVGQGA